MNTTEKIKFMRDFLSVYEQDRGNFLPDESLSPFTDEQLKDLRAGFEECTDLFCSNKINWSGTRSQRRFANGYPIVP
jgi:hypothetical protein